MSSDPRVGTLRELLRHVQAWRSTFEAHGVEDLRCPDGSEWSLWDIEYLIDHGLPRLPRRQREAIILCLIQGRREVDAAVIMGVSPTNPVAMYATDGIKGLLAMIDKGQLERFRPHLLAAA